jgi:hypothetical protein
MTRETAGTLMNFEYTFDAEMNDGRVTRRKDHVSGEDVVYLYDSLGRLTSPDPYEASAGAGDPGSWNRYAYAYMGGDPVNKIDPLGLYWLWADIHSYAEVGTGAVTLGGMWGCGMLGWAGGTFCALWEPIPYPVSSTEPHDPKASCRIAVSSSGVPRGGQSFSGKDIPYAPHNDQLGAYDTPNRSDLGPQFRGWFFAFQVQEELIGDTDPANWTISQTSSTSGTMIIHLLGEKSPSSIQQNVPEHEDNPRKFAVGRGTGFINCLDAPGFPCYQPRGGLVVGADVTMRFTSSLRHTSGATCSISWTLTLDVKDGKGGMRR